MDFDWNLNTDPDIWGGDSPSFSDPGDGGEVWALNTTDSFATSPNPFSLQPNPSIWGDLWGTLNDGLSTALNIWTEKEMVDLRTEMLLAQRDYFNIASQPELPTDPYAPNPVPISGAYPLSASYGQYAGIPNEVWIIGALGLVAYLLLK